MYIYVHTYMRMYTRVAWAMAIAVESVTFYCYVHLEE